MVNTTFKDFIWDFEQQILRLESRLHFLEAFAKQLASPGEKIGFQIRNDIVWHLVQDSYDLLVIDMASFCKGLWSEKGFFNALGNYLNLMRQSRIEKAIFSHGDDSKEMSRTAIDSTAVEINAYFAKRVNESVKKALAELFPASVKRTPMLVTADDIAALKNSFSSVSDEILRDFRKYRAHRFEKKIIKGILSDRPDLKKLRDQFEYMKKTFNGLRLICDQSTLAYTDLNGADSEKTARDVLDLVLFGGINEVVSKVGMPDAIGTQSGKRWYWQFREPLDRWKDKLYYPFKDND